MTRIRPGIALVLIPVMLLAAGVLRATAVEPGNQYFERTWTRTDLPVANGIESRTWMWGPEAFTETMFERYVESPGNQRVVQYFDKSRMEITQPADDSTSIWYVTNGLLVVELMSGNMQLGDDTFEQRSPANVNVAGDFDDPSGPTYAGMAGLQSAPPLATGSTVTQRVHRNGNVSIDNDLADYNVSVNRVDGVTNHSIAAPFWAFMNSSGTVYASGQYVFDNLFANEYFATGRPIIEPYWALVEVGGVTQNVLLQCFERRCLTYTPDNPPGWQVEAGNVGQHYYAWRYGGNGTSTATASPTSAMTPDPTASVTETATPTTTASETVTPSVTPEPEGPFTPVETCGGPLVPNAPEGIAIGPDGSVFISDTRNHRIIKLSAAGQYLFAWGSRGAADGQLLSPRGLTVDSQGQVYIADYFNNQIQVFNSSGGFLRSIGETGSGEGEFNGPTDVAIASGVLYITDRNNDRVQVFTLQGQYLREWGSSGSGNGQFDRPAGIATASDGTIYVVDEGNSRVQYFSSDQDFLGVFGSFGGGQGQFLDAYGIAIDPLFGYVYVVDRGNGNVQVFNALGSYLFSFGSSGSGPGEFAGPTAIATDGTDNIWITDQENMRVQHWASNGPAIEYQDEWSQDQSGRYSRPVDVAVDINNFTYVVDSYAHRITKLTGSCEYDRSWGHYGSGNTGYLSPVAAAISPDNLIYVVDQGNARVKVTSNIGTYVREWGGFGSNPGEFNIPNDLAFGPTGNVYVVDSGNNRVQVFDALGVYQTSFGTTGSGAGQFNFPTSIAIASNQIYVVDANNFRVQVFNLNGGYITELAAPPNTSWSVIDDIATDPDGYLYVLSSGWQYVHSLFGVYVDRYRLENTASDFIGGDGMSFSPSGVLYVVDSFQIGLYKYEVNHMP